MTVVPGLPKNNNLNSLRDPIPSFGRRRFLDAVAATSAIKVRARAFCSGRYKVYITSYVRMKRAFELFWIWRELSISLTFHF